MLAWDVAKGALFAIADNASLGIVGQIAEHGFGFDVKAQSQDFYLGAAAGSAVTGGVGTTTASGGTGAAVALVASGAGAPAAVPAAGVAAYGGAVAVKSAVAGTTYSAMAANATTGGSGPVQAGKEGESRASAHEDLGARERYTGESGKPRVSDGSTPTKLNEVKNVAKQGWTSQLKDAAAQAKGTGRQFQLWLRPTTTITAPLENARQAGEVVVRCF
jgi:hypothetical protein